MFVDTYRHQLKRNNYEKGSKNRRHHCRRIHCASHRTASRLSRENRRTGKNRRKQDAQCRVRLRLARHQPHPPFPQSIAHAGRLLAEGQRGIRARHPRAGRRTDGNGQPVFAVRRQRLRHLAHLYRRHPPACHRAGGRTCQLGRDEDRFRHGRARRHGRRKRHVPHQAATGGAGRRGLNLRRPPRRHVCRGAGTDPGMPGRPLGRTVHAATQG